MMLQVQQRLSIRGSSLVLTMSDELRYDDNVKIRNQEDSGYYGCGKHLIFGIRRSFASHSATCGERLPVSG
jgi:hypothetical protein